MALPELPKDINLPEIEAEIERRCAQEAESPGTCGARVAVRVPPADAKKKPESFLSVINQTYKNLAKVFESAELPKSKVDLQLRINAAFKFLATCVLWNFGKEHFHLFQGVVGALLTPKTGICDVLKEWRAECKQAKGKSLTAEARKHFDKSMASLADNLKLLADAAIVTQGHIEDFIRRPPGNIFDLETLLALPELDPEDVAPTLFGPAPFPLSPNVPILNVCLASCTMMLVELRAAYSEPGFHAEYIKLRHSPAAHGHHVEHALAVQVPILKKYGFEESLRGVMDMRAQTTLLSFDVVVLKLLRDIHQMLEAQKPLPQPLRWHFESGWRPPQCLPHSLGVQVVQTCRDTGDRMEVKETLPLTPDFEFSGPTVKVDLKQLDQVILGFGGAFTEASALVFQGLHPDLQKEILELYFGQEGLGYSLGRVHINSCDFSMGNYSFDDVPEDHDLVHFDQGVTRDAKAVIPMIKAAQELIQRAGGKLRLLASPWSPPAWMKTNGAMNGSHMPGLREDCRDTWARYFALWIAAYRQHGIPIWAVTVQNEPEHNAPWEACCYTATDEAEFIAGHLGPTLTALHPDVGIFAYDHNKDHVHEWSCQLFRDKAAMPFVKGIAFHWYAGDHFEKVRRTHEDFPTAILLPSEACYERHRWKSQGSLLQGDWSFGEGYAHDIIGNLNAGGAGWIDWNLLLNEDGGPNHVGNVCDAPVIASLTEQQIHVHPQFFFLGHFAKYVTPGSKRLLTVTSQTPTYAGAARRYGTCSAQDGLQAASFLRPDGVVVVVVLNAADLPISFKLQFSSQAVHASIPPRAIQTYLVVRSLL